VQVLSLGARFLHISPAILAGVGGLIVVTRIGQSILVFNATVRLPLVTGWDHLLPAWFTKLHSKHRTPTGSIVTIAGFALLMSFLGNTGAGAQEAYQLFQNGAGILYAVPYFALFLIPILDAAEPLWYRCVALSGFLMTLLYAALSVFPIVRVAEGSGFTVKLIGLVVAVNIAGSLFYWNADRRRKLRT